MVVKVHRVTQVGFEMNERTRILHSHSCQLHFHWSVRRPTPETHASLHHCKLFRKAPQEIPKFFSPFLTAELFQDHSVPTVPAVSP